MTVSARSIFGRSLKLFACLDHAVYRRALLYHHVAAGVEHHCVLASLDCATIVDIGANCGQFALAARHNFPDALIVSFEPLLPPAAKYAAVFKGDAHAVLHRRAIGPQRTQATIHISRQNDSSSLLPICDTQSKYFPGTEEVGTATVDVGPLESFVVPEEIRAQALLKLDVQGYEIQALEGCESLLDRFAYVYVECSFVELYAGQAFADEVIAWLRKRSFRLSGVYNMTYDKVGHAIQGDFLFASSFR